MSTVQITTMGMGDYGRLSQVIDNKSERAAIWNELLIDNKDGMIVNNTSGTLHYDDHKRMLDDVVEARKYMPTVFSTLSSVPGISVPVSLTDTLVGYQNMSEFGAKTSMNGSNRTSNQSDYQYAWTPQPIYHCDWHIPWRQGGFGYKTTDGSRESALQVALERDRTMVLGNDNIVVNVNGVDAKLYGLTNFPGTLQLPGGISDWADETNSNVVSKEAIGLASQLYSNRIAAQIPNSVLMFVANDIWPQLDQDYSTEKGDRTNLERLRAITAIRDVVPSQWLPDGAVLLVEATPMTLRIPTATDISVSPWQQIERMADLKFTTFAASTVQPRVDRNGNTGLLYATKA